MHLRGSRVEYRIPASSFQKEGIYELLLSSEDRANNQSDTGMQGKRVTFALDWTAPECLITGVKGGEALSDRQCRQSASGRRTMSECAL